MRMVKDRLVRKAPAGRLRPDSRCLDVYHDPRMREWRRLVVERAAGRCQMCGARGTRLWADHIVEIKDGGAPFDLSNGQALCPSCHTRKTMMVRGLRARDTL